MSHYRKITPTDLRGLLSALTENDVAPSEYAALASFQAVRVGKDGNGAFMVEVFGDDADDLPGKFLSADFQGLQGASRKAVHRTRVKEQDEDGKDFEREYPESDVPLGADIVETEINPHAFG